MRIREVPPFPPFLSLIQPPWRSAIYHPAAPLVDVLCPTTNGEAHVGVVKKVIVHKHPDISPVLLKLSMRLSRHCFSGPMFAFRKLMLVCYHLAYSR